MHTAITDLEQAQIRSDIPDFRPGDTLKVHVRVVEGSRSRIQVFQGVVIRRQGGGARETFTVRKISYGVGVERTFPVHSPTLDKIEVVTRGRVRRAKLYYLRSLRGKSGPDQGAARDASALAAATSQRRARMSGHGGGAPLPGSPGSGDGRHAARAAHAAGSAGSAPDRRLRDHVHGPGQGVRGPGVPGPHGIHG